MGGGKTSKQIIKGSRRELGMNRLEERRDSKKLTVENQEGGEYLKERET